MDPATDRTRQSHVAGAVMAIFLMVACGGVQTWYPCDTAKVHELRFRALLTASGPGQIVLARA
jgi:hypothetical protein